MPHPVEIPRHVSKYVLGAALALSLLGIAFRNRQSGQGPSDPSGKQWLKASVRGISGEFDDASVVTRELFSPRGFQIRGTNGECLDAGGEHVHLWECNRSNKNQFWVQPAEGGQIAIDDASCLDRKDAVRVSTCHNSTNAWAKRNQLWAYDKHTRLLKAHGGVCLDRGGSLHVWSCNASNLHQLWTLVRRSLPTPTSRVAISEVTTMEQAATTIAQAVAWRRKNPEVNRLVPCGGRKRVVHIVNHKGQCLDAGGESVHTWTCNGSNAKQHWVHDHTGLVKEANHNLCLDMGGKIHLWPCNSSNVNQLWSFDEGTERISAQGGDCLDAGGSLHPWRCNSTNPSQRWKIVEVKTLHDADSPCNTSFSDIVPRTARNIPNKSSAVRQSVSMTRAVVATTHNTATNSTSHESIAGAATKAQALVYFQQTHELCLDAGAGGHLHVARCNSSNTNQSWIVSDGGIKLSTHMCLSAGAVAYVRLCDVSNASERLAYNDSTAEIKNGDGFCLAPQHFQENGSLVIMRKCDTRPDAQRWSLGRKHFPTHLRVLSIATNGERPVLSGLPLEEVEHKGAPVSIALFIVFFLIAIALFSKGDRRVSSAADHRTFRMHNDVCPDQEAGAPLVKSDGR